VLADGRLTYYQNEISHFPFGDEEKVSNVFLFIIISDIYVVVISRECYTCTTLRSWRSTRA
jgi:hypothetical protein